MADKKLMWEVFMETGDIEVYLSYKDKCRKEETKCKAKVLKQKQ